MKELRDWVAEQVGAIAKPDDIRFADNLPKTRSGKIMRRLLKSVARGEEITQDVSTLENPAILDQLRGTDSGQGGKGAAPGKRPARRRPGRSEPAKSAARKQAKAPQARPGQASQGAPRGREPQGARQDGTQGHAPRPRRSARGGGRGRR